VAIDNIAFTVSNPGTVQLHNFNDTVIVRLEKLREGKYVVFGRVVIHNSDGDNQNASAAVTTLDGATQLDRADVRIAGGGGAIDQAVSLQATYTLPSPGTDSTVDIRCATYNGAAVEASLFAILVDGIETQ
jgi:hypothetical protein